jgi:hypothetical protein
MDANRLVRRQNVERYLRFTEIVTDETERQRALLLLVEERQKRHDVNDKPREP